MHIRMLLDYRRPVELITELVQSTDQAWHHAFETCAALVASA